MNKIGSCFTHDYTLYSLPTDAAARRSFVSLLTLAIASIASLPASLGFIRLQSSACCSMMARICIAKSSSSSAGSPSSNTTVLATTARPERPKGREEEAEAEEGLYL